MPSLPSCFGKSGLASPLHRKLKHVNGALANLVSEVLTLAALASSLARLQESPAPLALMLSLVDAKRSLGKLRSGSMPGQVATALQALLQLGVTCRSWASSHTLKEVGCATS